MLQYRKKNLTIVKAYNPCAIRPLANGELWEGQIGLVEANNAGLFCQFQSFNWGIRAGARLLKTYRHKYGLDTIDGIIRRWAPENENNTSAYIEAVAQYSQISANQYIPENYNNIKRVLQGIIRVECGYYAVTREELKQGLELAGYPSAMSYSLWI